MKTTAALDDLTATAEVVVVVGTGGVGKTTTAAALGVRAATEHGRRVLVLTVDPARRLADALGVEATVDEPILVPVGDGSGRLWVRMVDMATSWDRLVEQCAPDARVADELLANRLYRSLTTHFIQSHDYIALDQLHDLAGDERYDLIVVDTPPSAHVLDLIDAPGRMVEFLDSRLLDVLTGGSVGRGIGQWAAKPFLQIAQRLLGSDFLGQISRFFLLLRRLGPQFRARADRVEALLVADTTSWVAVTTAVVSEAGEYRRLLSGLADRSVKLDMVVLNRSLRETIAPGNRWDVDGRVAGVDDLLGAVEDAVADPSLERAMVQWAKAAMDEPAPGDTVVAVGLKPEGVDGVDDLSRFFD